MSQLATTLKAGLKVWMQVPQAGSAGLVCPILVSLMLLNSMQLMCAGGVRILVFLFQGNPSNSSSGVTVLLRGCTVASNVNTGACLRHVKRKDSIRLLQHHALTHPFVDPFVDTFLPQAWPMVLVTEGA
jgi:hypothetical protein